MERGELTRWSGDIPIKCDHCGEIHFYHKDISTGIGECWDCQAPLSLDLALPASGASLTRFYLDAEGNFVGSDDLWEEVTHLESRQVTGMDWTSCICESHFDILHEKWLRMMGGDGSFIEFVDLLGAEGREKPA